MGVSGELFKTRSWRPWHVFNNPVLRRELLTGLRENKAFVFHFIFILVLGAVVILAWPDTDSSTMQQRRAQELFKTFGIGQLILLGIMTPAFSAGAFTSEKERHSLDLLLTAPVPHRTILLGKYFSAVLYLWLLILSTAPLATVCLWLGGIGDDAVMGMYLLLTAAASAFGMIGVVSSIFFDRTQVSLSVTYLAVLPPVLILTAFAWLMKDFFVLSSAVWPAAVLLVLTFIMYRTGLARLKKPFDPVPKSSDEENPEEQTGLVLLSDRFPDNLLVPARGKDLLPDKGNPIFYKETRSDILGRGTVFLRIVLQVGLFLAVAAMVPLFFDHEYVFVAYLIVFSMVTAPAVSCNVFTQERERGTLELLLTTPLKPSAVVTGKFIARGKLSLNLLGIVGVMLIFMLMLSKIDFELRLFGFFIYVGIILSTLFFELALAFFCSMVFRTTFQSMIATYGILFLLFVVPIAAQHLMVVFAEGLTLQEIAWVGSTSPFGAIMDVHHFLKDKGQAIFETVWIKYLAFTISVSVLLSGYVYLLYARWTAQSAQRSRVH